MPKKSKKSLSKRVKLKDKFKVIRKVKEHNRKQRKEAKKQGKRKPSVLRDPGIPANFPYREQIVKELEFERQRILSQAAARKEDSKRKRQAAAQVPNSVPSLASRSDRHGKTCSSTSTLFCRIGMTILTCPEMMTVQRSWSPCGLLLMQNKRSSRH